MATNDDKIVIENINKPGYTERVNRDKYEAMREALLSVLPKEPPGLTAAEAKEALTPLLPQALFPEGATSGWWLKAVQLDLEAKKIVVREKTKPLRFRLA
jgi:hypothetical protein